jgi:hypothetical protein
MQTRSQTKYEQSSLFQVNIDFDDASECWRQNKKSLANGMYKYICPQTKKDGSKCGNSCHKNSDYCWTHRSSNVSVAK